MKIIKPSTVKTETITLEKSQMKIDINTLLFKLKWER